MTMAADPVVANPTALPKVAPFPHHYAVRLDGREAAGVLIAPPRALIVGGAPVEFGGREDWWSPEHLLLASVSLCLKATFEALARARRLEIVRYEAVARGVLDRTPAGIAFTWLLGSVDLEVAPEQAAFARALLEKASRSCIVSKTLNVPVEYQATVNGE
jgi:organic hydroperoxide reductase OsmC/OhrA